MDAFDTHATKEHKTYSTTGQRLPWAGVQPKRGKPWPPFTFTDSDLVILCAFQRHGKLTARFVAHLVNRSYPKVQQRLARMTYQTDNGFGGALLSMPYEQFNSRNVRHQDLVYELTDHGKLALLWCDALNLYARPERGHFVHSLAINLTTAAFEIAVLKAGFRFIDAEEIFTSSYCPDSTRQSKNPMELPVGSGSLIHDSLFGIDYNGPRRYFVLEVGRRTEQTKEKPSDPATFLHKIVMSSQAFDQGIYKAHWGLQRNPLFLSLHTSARNMDFQSEATKKHATNAKRYLFRTQSVFGRKWEVPKPEDMLTLFNDFWYTLDEPYYINRT